MNLHPGRHPLPPPVAIQKRADLIPQKTRLLPAIMIEIIPAKTPKQKFMPASTHPKRDQTSRQRKEPDRFIFEKKLLDKIGRAHSELQSRGHLVCRLLLEKKKNI